MTSGPSIPPSRPAPAGKGKAFFDRGDQVAATNNWDFAIQMYLEGIKREPGNLERGHQPLREVALKRKMSGGKSIGLMDQLKGSFGGRGKEPVDGLLQAEHAWALDPGNVSHMVSTLKAAQKMELVPLAGWVCGIIFDAMRQAKRPDKGIIVSIAEGFAANSQFAEAASVCDLAVQFYPDDVQLSDMVRNFMAKHTIDAGKYDGSGSFKDSVKDLARQKALIQGDNLVQSKDFLQQEVERSQQEYEAASTVPGKIDAYVEALTRLEEESYENTAIDVLKKAFADTTAYRFKSKQDEIRIRQIRRRYNKLKEAGRRDEAIQVAKELLDYELKVYAERAEKYPTDMSIKYELGRRQLTVGQIDEAIASLQQAQRDPKRRATALSLLGQAFNRKGWHREAAETYGKALELDPTEERAKELRYNLGISLEAMEDFSKALDQYSQVAQIDYNYKDVRKRIEDLRKKVG